MHNHPIFKSVYCSALDCPTHQGGQGRIPIDDTYKDATGRYWCNACQTRGKLMDWASQHHWPELHCAPYAVGADQELWQAAMTMGKVDFIDKLAALVFAESEED